MKTAFSLSWLYPIQSILHTITPTFFNFYDTICWPSVKRKVSLLVVFCSPFVLAIFHANMFCSFCAVSHTSAKYLSMTSYCSDQWLAGKAASWSRKSIPVDLQTVQEQSSRNWPTGHSANHQAENIWPASQPWPNCACLGRGTGKRSNYFMLQTTWNITSGRCQHTFIFYTLLSFLHETNSVYIHIFIYSFMWLFYYR